MVSSSINRCCSSCTEAGRDLADSQLHHAVQEYGEAVAYEHAMRRRVWFGVFALAALFWAGVASIWVVLP